MGQLENTNKKMVDGDVKKTSKSLVREIDSLLTSFQGLKSKNVSTKVEKSLEIETKRKRTEVGGVESSIGIRNVASAIKSEVVTSKISNSEHEDLQQRFAKMKAEFHISKKEWVEDQASYENCIEGLVKKQSALDEDMVHMKVKTAKNEEQSKVLKELEGKNLKYEARLAEEVRALEVTLMESKNFKRELKVEVEANRGLQAHIGRMKELLEEKTNEILSLKDQVEGCLEKTEYKRQMNPPVLTKEKSSPGEVKKIKSENTKLKNLVAKMKAQAKSKKDDVQLKVSVRPKKKITKNSKITGRVKSESKKTGSLT